VGFHQLRLLLKRTQEEIALDLQISVSTVRNWEQGRSKPIPKLLRKLMEMANKKGLGVDHLINQNRQQELH
jgi:DNA-binding transcriptional regulator YiaG